MGEMKNANKVLVGKRGRKVSPERHIHKWEGNILNGP
jgi:hypothetical protein